MVQTTTHDCMTASQSLLTSFSFFSPITFFLSIFPSHPFSLPTYLSATTTFALIKISRLTMEDEQRHKGPSENNDRHDRGRDPYRSPKHDKSKDYRSMSPGDDFYKRRYFDLLRENDMLRDELRTMRKKLAANGQNSPRRHRSKSPRERKRSRSPDSSHRADDRLRLSGRDNTAIDATAATRNSNTMRKRPSVGSAKDNPKKLCVQGHGRPGRPPKRSHPSLLSQQENTQTVHGPPTLNQPLPRRARRVTAASNELSDVDEPEQWFSSPLSDL